MTGLPVGARTVGLPEGMRGFGLPRLFAQGFWTFLTASSSVIHGKVFLFRAHLVRLSKAGVEGLGA